MNLNKVIFLPTCRIFEVLNKDAIWRASLKSCTKIHRSVIVGHVNSKIHTDAKLRTMKDFQPTDKELAPREQMFNELTVKDKKVFVRVLDSFQVKDRLKRGHIEFIYAALKQMKEFGVEGDVEIYKKLMDIFPKGQMIPKNMIQAEFYHFARHQDCGVFLLDQMERLGVFPDREMGQIILSCFGLSTHVYKKYCRMMYWMPKLKNLNPYLLPDPLPRDVRELARMALGKMSVDSRTKIEEFEAEVIEDSVDKTWIMSAQSPVQQKLIEDLSSEKPVFVEGPFLVWLRKLTMTYYVLRADSKIYPNFEVDEDDVANLSLWMFGEPKPVELTLRPSSVHEQEEGIFLGMCCTGTSSKDSLLSWIRFLTKSNPKLDKVQVLFTLRSPPTSIVPVNACAAGKMEGERDISEASDHIVQDAKS